jgi:uncharacterized protein
MTLPVKVLDAFAVMAFLESEPGAASVRQLLLQAVRGELRLLLTVVNLGEVYYSITRAASQATADETLDALVNLPLDVVDVDWELARQAAVLKSVTPIAYGDCFAAGLAITQDCPVVTSDPEFRRLANRVRIEWI